MAIAPSRSPRSSRISRTATAQRTSRGLLACWSSKNRRSTSACPALVAQRLAACSHGLSRRRFRASIQSVVPSASACSASAASARVLKRSARRGGSSLGSSALARATRSKCGSSRSERRASRWSAPRRCSSTRAPSPRSLVTLRRAWGRSEAARASRVSRSRSASWCPGAARLTAASTSARASAPRPTRDRNATRSSSTPRLQA